MSNTDTADTTNITPAADVQAQATPENPTPEREREDPPDFDVRAGAVVIASYERDLAAAAAAGDIDALEDIQADYQEAREKRARRAIDREDN